MVLLTANPLCTESKHFIKSYPLLTSHGKERNDKVSNTETEDSGVSFDPPPNGVTAEYGSRIRMEDINVFTPYLIDSLTSLAHLRVLLLSSMEPEVVKALSSDPQRVSPCVYPPFL